MLSVLDFVSVDIVKVRTEHWAAFCTAIGVCWSMFWGILCVSRTTWFRFGDGGDGGNMWRHGLGRDEKADEEESWRTLRVDGSRAKGIGYGFQGWDGD